MSSPPILRVQVPADPESLARVRVELNQSLERIGVDPRERQRLVLAIDEACANVIRHAYRNCGPGAMELRVEQHRGQLRFRLRDHAPPVDPHCLKPRDLGECRPGGLGINIIDCTMDRWWLRPLRRGCGNVLTMIRKFRRSRP